MEKLDVRGLPHPERPPLVLKKLREVGELELIVEVEPKPLITMLKEKGYICEPNFDGEKWIVKIRRI